MADFATACTRNAGELGMELLAQVRPNGRVLDHYRISMGGSRIIDVNAPMSLILAKQRASGLRFRYQVWPKDVTIRRNMTTSLWANVYDLLSARAASVTQEDGTQVPTEVLLEEMKEAKSDAAIRFAVVIGEDSRMQLQLQSLPSTAATLMGKPAFRG